MLQLQYNMSVIEALSREYLYFDQSAPFVELLSTAKQMPFGDAYVLKDKALVGVLTSKEVLIAVQKGLALDTPVGSLAKRPIVTVSPEMSLKACRDIMVKEKVHQVPVVDKGIFLGVIGEKELYEYYYSKLEGYYEQLSRVVESVHEAVCVIDSNGIVIVWNESAVRLYGTSKEEILGAPIASFFPNAMSLKVLESKKAIWNVYHSPRENFHVILSTEPIFMNGEFIGVVSTDRDVTEMEKMTNRLEKAHSKVKFLENQVKRYTHNSFESIVGNSETIVQKIRMAEQVAPTEATILITGESGTGKEVFAQAIHEASGRKGLFVPLNCSAIPAGLFESELFGYVEGAFTGARKSGKMGVFEMAGKGTVFLDEIGEMPLHMQAKLLRVLQEKEVQRVGSEKHIKVSARVISATNKDLKAMVKEGKFREDLYYRLNVVEIDLPSLKERKADISLLVAVFFKEFCKKENRPMPVIKPEVMTMLENYHWEGNVRQLKNTVEYLLVMSNDQVISAEQVPQYIRNHGIQYIDDGGDSLDLNAAIQRVEADVLRRALEKADGSKAKAARLLNIPRTTLYYKLNYYGLD